MDLPGFADLLRSHRLAAGLSQEALAERSGLSLQAISLLERGQRQGPRRPTVSALAAALGLTAPQRDALDSAARRRRRPRPAPPARPAGLPGAGAPILGRDADLAVLPFLLRQPDTRLLTLVGPAGVGKTRLALEIAVRVGTSFRDGVTWVDLAPIHDAGLVAQTVAQRLGLRVLGNECAERLRAQLREADALLVLDNLEQVLPAGSLLQDLLDACPHLRILATSRVALRLRNERPYVVAPLSLPPIGQDDPQAVSEYAAVAMFLARAREVVPDLVLTGSTAPVVAAVCRRLDGLPLAIELAAALARLVPPQAMLAQLKDKAPAPPEAQGGDVARLQRAVPWQGKEGPALDLLASGGWDRPDRQQTMRNAIAWSYELLSPAEQTVFRGLGIFVDGWTLEAAAVVLGVPAETMVEILQALSEKHLVRPVESIVDAARFGLLETIREYAWERLVTCGELPFLRDAHLRYYAALAATARREMVGPDQVQWMERLRSEVNNIRTALDWALQSGQANTGLRLAAEVGRFWDRQSYLQEGRAWLESLLALPGADASPAQALACLTVGKLAYRQGDHPVAVNQLLRSRALYHQVGEEEGAQAAASNLANVYLGLGEYAQAVALYEETLAAYRAGNRRWDIASSLNNLGEALRHQGAFERARACYEESLAVYREIGDLWSIASVLDNLAGLSCQEGDLDRAEALALEALALNSRLKERQGTAAIHLNLGKVAVLRGNSQEALAHFMESLQEYRRRGYAGGVAACLDGIARCLTLERQPEPAARLYGAAAGLRTAAREPIPPSERAPYEADLSLVRAALPPERFRAAWDAGGTLGMDGAVAEAAQVVAFVPQQALAP